MSLEELLPDHAELQALLEQQSNSPENQALGAEQKSLLHRAVLSLPPILRVVLVLHDMEELSTEQVAVILGLRPGTVAVRLHRARLTLRKEMNSILKGEARPEAAPARAATHSKPRARARRSAQCLEHFAKLSDYLDGTVSASTCEQIQAHMNACPNCVAFLNDLRASIDRCKGLEISCDPAVTARLRTLFTQEYLRMLGGSAGDNGSAKSNHPARST